MNREIKFRGKSLEDGKWLFGDLMKHKPFIDERYYIKQSIGSSYTWHHVYSESVGQFTGLLDKNGKEIYEGDIVRIFGKIAKVEYSIAWGGWIFLCEEMGDSKDLPFSDGEKTNTTEAEIIGNVFENPELLNT